MANTVTGALSVAQTQTVLYTPTGGLSATYATVQGTYAGAVLVFEASTDNANWGTATAINLTGGGSSQKWALATNGTVAFDLSSVAAGAYIRCKLKTITSGTVNVTISNFAPSTNQALPYSASITPDPSLGTLMTVTATDGNAFTINAPAVALSLWPIVFIILNSSGTTLGTITWNGAFKLAGAFTNPANGKQRLITFQWNGSNWLETSRTAADM